MIWIGEGHAGINNGVDRGHVDIAVDDVDKAPARDALTPGTNKA